MALTFQPIRRLSDLAGQWQVAEASPSASSPCLTHGPGQRPAEAATPIRRGTGNPLRSGRVSYPDRPVLQDLTFTAEAGKDGAELVRRRRCS
jgi:hypothetical protein